MSHDDEDGGRNVPGMPGGLMRRPDAPLPLTERRRLSNFVKGQGFLSPTQMQIRELSMQWDIEKSALPDEESVSVARLRTAAHEGGKASGFFAGLGLAAVFIAGGVVAVPSLGVYAFAALVPAGLSIFWGGNRWGPRLAENAELKVLEHALANARRGLTADPVGGASTPVALPGVRPRTSVDSDDD